MNTNTKPQGSAKESTGILIEKGQGDCYSAVLLKEDLIELREIFRNLACAYKDDNVVTLSRYANGLQTLDWLIEDVEFVDILKDAA